MAEQVLIDVTLGKSIQDLEKLLKESTKEMKNLDLSTQAGKDSFKKLSETIGQVKTEQDKLKQAQQQYSQQTQKDIDMQRAYDIALGKVDASLGDMQKALKLLKNESFEGKTKEEIGKLNSAVGTLKNNIQDSVALNKALDKGEVFNNMRAGLQGAVAAAQLLGAGLKLIGVESEGVKKLEAATLQLISASQALQVIRDLHDKGTVKALVIQTKDLALKAISTAQTWAQTTATNAAAAAEANKAVIMGKASLVTKAVAAVQWLWNAAMMANPIGLIIAGVAALVGGIILLTGALSKSTEESRRAALANKTLNETLLEGRKSVEEQIVKVDVLTSVINDTTKSTKERTLALNELNSIMGTNLTLTDNVTDATKKYVQQLIVASQVDAAIKKIAELNTTLLDTSKLYKDSAPDAISFLLSGMNVAKGMQDQMENYKSNIKDTKAQIESLTKFVEDKIGTQLKNEKENEKTKTQIKSTTKSIEEQANEVDKLSASVEKLTNTERDLNIELAKQNELKLQPTEVDPDEEINILTEKLESEQELKDQFTEWDIINYGSAADQKIAADNRIQKNFEDNEGKKKAGLDDWINQLANVSNINQKMMENELLQAGENERQKAAIKKKYAMRQTVIDIATIGMNTAKAVMAAGNFMPPASFIFQAIELAMGAAQIGLAISNQSKINAAAGGGTFRTSRPTMLMVGDNPGGVEEVNVRPISGVGQTRVNPSSGMIQMAGGGSVISDGGYGSRFAKGNNNNDIKQAIIEGMMQAPAPNLNYSQYEKFEAKQVRINKNNTL